jgi:hypothetical protein
LPGLRLRRLGWLLTISVLASPGCTIRSSVILTQGITDASAVSELAAGDSIAVATNPESSAPELQRDIATKLAAMPDERSFRVTTRLEDPLRRSPPDPLSLIDRLATAALEHVGRAHEWAVWREAD